MRKCNEYTVRLSSNYAYPEIYALNIGWTVHADNYNNAQVKFKQAFEQTFGAVYQHTAFYIEYWRPVQVVTL